MRKKSVTKGGGLLLLASLTLASGISESIEQRNLQTIDGSITFHQKLPCYPCIMNGWTFCQDGKDQPNYTPDFQCCKSLSECDKLSDPAWTCSSSYNNKLYSLSMCPFLQNVCQTTSSRFVFKSDGASLNLKDMKFGPSDICVFTIRTECGIPAFSPDKLTSDTLNIVTIEYDDTEVDYVNTTITDGTTTNYIPIPKKSESFDGQGAKRVPTESQLLYTKTNTNGSVTYFYQNGTLQTVEQPKVVTFFDDQVKDYQILYPNQTNITYNLDGSQVVESFVNGQKVTQSIPKPTRLLQTVDTTNQIWGTIFFYMDGRIKEILPTGAVYWNFKFYDPNQNPNRQNATAVNSTFHMRVRYNSQDGTFIQYKTFPQEATEFFNSSASSKGSSFVKWSDYFKTNTKDPADVNALTHPKYDSQLDAGTGITTITYTNDTTRKQYKVPGANDERSAKMRATAYDDIFTNNTFNRVYWNGTIAVFKYNDANQETFVRYIKAPLYFFEESKYFDYADTATGTQKPSSDIDVINKVTTAFNFITGDSNSAVATSLAGLSYSFDGFSLIRYENFTERLYYRVSKVSDSRYYNLTSIQYEEHFYNNSDFYRVVYNNGTIALYNYIVYINPSTGTGSDTVYTTKVIKAPMRQDGGADLKIGATNEANIYKTPRPYGALGGFNTITTSNNKGPITFGSRLQFLRYERAPFAYARDFIQFNNTDGSFWRQFEIENSRGSSASGTWKYMYQNWTVPLNAQSSTFDNNTKMLYNQSCAVADLTTSPTLTDIQKNIYNPCFQCKDTYQPSGDNTYTLEWEYRVYVNSSAACFIKSQTFMDGSVKKSVLESSSSNNYLGMHCAYPTLSQPTGCNSPTVTASIVGTENPCRWGNHSFNAWSVLPKDLTKTNTPDTTKNTYQDATTTYIKTFPDEETIDNIAFATDKVYSKIVKYHKNDTWFYFPRDLPVYATEYDKNTRISYTIRYRDGSTKTFYNNRTIANFDSKGVFVSYERAPTSLATFFPVSGPYADNSYWIDFTSFNNTRRFIQGAALRANSVVGAVTRYANTSFEIATALLFQDVYGNGTVRNVYTNGTIAIFRFNGFIFIFQRYERAPSSFFIDCTRTFGVDVNSDGVASAIAVDLARYPDYTAASKTAVETLINNGGWWSNCTNGTRFLFGPKVTAASSAFLQATAHIYDDVFTNGTKRRFYRNGTRSIFQSNAFIDSFISWEVAPTSYFESCTTKKTKTQTQTDAGGAAIYWPWADDAQWLNCSVGASGWNATIYYRTMLQENSEDSRDLRLEYYTGVQLESFYPSGLMRRTYRNGTIALFQFNGLFYAFNRFEKSPSSLYVDCDKPAYGWLTKDYVVTALPSDVLQKYNMQAPLISESGSTPAIAGWYEIPVPDVTPATTPATKDKPTSCAKCLAQVTAWTAPSGQFKSGKYLCELIVAGPREYKCYAEIVGADPGAITYSGYFTNRLNQPKDAAGANLLYDTLAACAINTSPTLTNGVYSTTHTTGCPYQCQTIGMWLKHGDLNFDFETDPSKVSAQCVKLNRIVNSANTADTKWSCLCVQEVDTDSSKTNAIFQNQKQRWRNCTNGTTILDYEPSVAQTLSSAKLSISKDAATAPNPLPKSVDPFTKISEDDQKLWEKFINQIQRDEVYPNGTRTRYYTNGTVTFLNFDQSIETTIVPPSYIFSLWTDYLWVDGTDATKLAALDANGKEFYKQFDDKNTAEDKSLYYSIRVFKNGTVWWLMKQCKNDIAADTANEFKCYTDAPKTILDQRKEATQIRWYQTTGTTLNNTRIVYYTNDTVNRETWTWGTVAGVANTRTQVRDALLVKSPKGDFVPYTQTARISDTEIIKENSVKSLWLYSKNIGYYREYINQTLVPEVTGPPLVAKIPEVKSIFYYFRDPADTTNTPTWDATAIGDLPAQQKETIKNIGEYYIWDLHTAPTNVDCTGDVTYYPATPAPAPSGDRRCIQIMYRNGSQAIYKQTATTQATASPAVAQIPIWTFHAWVNGPLYLWSYITETYSYNWNRTQGTGSTLTWSLDKEASPSTVTKIYTQTVTGYELLATTNKTVFRYLTSAIEKTTFFDIAKNPNTDGKSDQIDWNYDKLIATSYNRYDRVPSGTNAFTFTVYFRNGTVAQFNNSVFAPNSFVRYVTAPKSYYSWYTTNDYADGTKEFVYSDFITITKGPSIPDPAPLNADINFDYQRNLATGLIDSIEYRSNGTRFSNYRNGSIAIFQNNKFSSWIVTPKSFWVWCSKIDNAAVDFVDYQCTNGTTIRVSRPITGSTDAINYKRAVYFGYIEIFDNGTTKTFFLNGSSGIFNSAGLVNWITPPTSYAVSRTVVGNIEYYSNATTRTVNPILPAQETDQTRAIGYLFIDTYTNGSQQIFYKNGSVAWFNSSGFVSWVVAPTSYYVSYEKNSFPDGDEYKFSNGTTRLVARAVKTSDSELYKRTSFEIFETYPNSSTKVTFRNGTVAMFNTSGFMYYIIPPEQYFYSFDDGSYRFFRLNDSLIINYNKPLTAASLILEKSVSYDFYKITPDGIKNVTYRNGTIALFSINTTDNTDIFLQYVVPPTSFFVNYADDAANADGIIKRTFDNGTIRYIYPALTAASSRQDNATSTDFYDFYPNGTARRFFRNGTVGVYFKGTFIQYDVKPDYMYIDFPTVDFADKSYEVYFFNGTRRWYSPPLTAANTARENKTGLWYTDCFPTGICNFVYRNYTVAVYVDGRFSRLTTMSQPATPAPPPPPPVITQPTPPAATTYQFVNKTGPKQQVYDPKQGGVKKYKEVKQSSDPRATLSNATEPLCKGRNQIIIMADKRIKSSVYLSARDLQASFVSDDTDVKTTSLSIQSVNFLPAGARALLAYASGLLMIALAYLY